MAPKVSVLIPAYNHDRYLDQALQSALGQTYRDLEVIVVDDGSTDNSADLVRQWAGDSRLTYIRQANQGVAGALNAGLSQARGEYIGILNDDDVWLPDKLERQVPVLDADPSIAVVYGMATAIDSLGNALPHTLSAPGRFPGDMLKSLLYQDSVCPSTALIRRQHIDHVGPWDVSLSGADDWDMFLRLARHWLFAYRHEVVARYRYHDSNYSGARSAGFASYQGRRVQVLDKFFEEDPGGARFAAMRPVAYRNLYTTVALQWIAAGDWRQGLASLAAAFRVSPTASTLLKSLSGLSFHFLRCTGWGTKAVARLTNWRIRHLVAVGESSAHAADSGFEQEWL